MLQSCFLELSPVYLLTNQTVVIMKKNASKHPKYFSEELLLQYRVSDSCFTRDRKQNFPNTLLLMIIFLAKG